MRKGLMRARRQGTEERRRQTEIWYLKYRRMEAVTIEQRLVARRSHIHGWGLFTNNTSSKTIPFVGT
jgi:hypothetical protein